MWSWLLVEWIKMESVWIFSLVSYLMTITNRRFQPDTWNLVHMYTLYSTVCKVTMVSIASIPKMYVSLYPEDYIQPNEYLKHQVTFKNRIK